MTDEQNPSKYVETILEKGLGFKLADGRLIEVSQIDAGILEFLTEIYTDLQIIKKHIA